jgi:hypothetical protein
MRVRVGMIPPVARSVSSSELVPVGRVFQRGVRFSVRGLTAVEEEKVGETDAKEETAQGLGGVEVMPSGP